MRINHNISALNAYRQLTLNNTSLQKSLEKLSSGFRINRAGDDAAGLAISEKMRGQIRGLEQAQRNAQDGISLIQTAEGALNEVHSILQRMRELAVQAANDTNTIDDRNEIQKEINQLSKELNRIASDTEFNTKKLLSGAIGATASIDSTANSAKVAKATVVTPTLGTGTYTFTFTVDTTTGITNITDAGTGIKGVTESDNTAHTFGNYQLKVTDDPNNAGKKLLTLINTDTGETIATLNNQDAKASDFELAGFTFTGDTTNGIANGSYSFTLLADSISVTVTDSNNNTVATASVQNWTKGYLEVAGVKLEFNADLTNNGSTDINIVNNAIQFHIGANESQVIEVAINDMSATALGVASLDVTSKTAAESAITAIDDAIKTVSAERSKLGAYQNRLEHTINNLGTAAENLTASESRIRDVDMAKEMMEFTKMNILNQAATAMLAQANMLPQSVLKLLG